MRRALALRLLLEHRKKVAGTIAAAIVCGFLLVMVLASAVVGIAAEQAKSCTVGAGDLTGVTMLAAGLSGRPAGFAIADANGEILAEHNGDATGNGRSMSKALVLLALTRAASERPLSAREQRLAGAMIRVSDNAASNQLIDLVGLERVNATARAAGMARWGGQTGTSAYRLGDAQVSAADFARLFATYDDLVPRRHRAFATSLLADVQGAGRFGALAAEFPGRVLSKGGWMPNDPTGWTVNQAVQVTIGGRRFGVAVVLGGQPSFEAGGHAIAKVMSAAFEALSQRSGGGTATSSGGLQIRAPDGTTVTLPAGKPYTGPDFMTEGSAYGPPWDPVMEGLGETATGVKLPPRPMRVLIPIVAVDDTRIPRYSKVWIWPNPHNYAGPFYALDVGGAIKGHNAVDFLVMEGDAAKNAWGRKQVLVSGTPIPEAARSGIASLDESASCAEAQDDTAGAPNLPATATELQQRAVHYATAIERLRLHYCYGGGHAPRVGPSYIAGDCWNASLDGRYHSGTGIDCSGAVRWLLVLMGYADPGGIASSGFGAANYGSATRPIRMQPGPGRWMTIYYNGDHIWVRILGRSWETSRSNYVHGPGWTERSTGAGYNVGHLPGM